MRAIDMVFFNNAMVKEKEVLQGLAAVYNR